MTALKPNPIPTTLIAELRSAAIYEQDWTAKRRFNQAADALQALIGERDALRRGLGDIVALPSPYGARVLAARLLRAGRDSSDHCTATDTGARSRSAIGPRPAVFVCTGCPAYETEKWREPSGDGETYDNGQYAWCNAADRRSMGAYHYDHSPAPEWCPALPNVPVDGRLRAAQDSSPAVRADDPLLITTPAPSASTTAAGDA